MNSVFITSLLTCLKKENKLCPNCLEWLGKVDKISQKDEKQKEINSKNNA